MRLAQMSKRDDHFAEFPDWWAKLQILYFLNIIFVYLDADVDEAETSYYHHKPTCIKTLLQSTQFSRRELQIIYRGFKEVRLACAVLRPLCKFDGGFTAKNQGKQFFLRDKAVAECSLCTSVALVRLPTSARVAAAASCAPGGPSTRFAVCHVGVVVCARGCGCVCMCVCGCRRAAVEVK